MLQDSFVDALSNKNCIFRNIAESHGSPKFPLNPVFEHVSNKKNGMTGLKGTWASLIVSCK